MFKKAVFFSLAVVWLLVGVTTMASAAQNVGNTSQKGSVLIFPKIDVTPGRDTIIRISNDYPRGTMIKCYWVNKDQEIQDFMFLVTITQPVWFRASDGLGTSSYNNDPSTNPITVPPFFTETVGELKCWAVNFEGTRQISWNHLSGNALVLDYVNQTAYEYNSVNFTARGVNLGAQVRPAGTINLSGAANEYDACPLYLVFNFFTYDPTLGSTRYVDIDGQGAAVRFNKTDLTLVPCKQDLRQDRVPTCTKAKFDIWNENETKYTGAYQCLKCWFEGYLNDIGTVVGAPGGFGGEKFTYPGLHTTMGRARVTGVASTVCNGKYPCTTQVNSPLLGITSTQVEFALDSPGKKVELIAAEAVGAGTYTADPVTIRWDIQTEPEEVSGR